MVYDMYVSLNDFYNEIGLEPINLGDEIGWNIDRRIDIAFELQESERDEPCFAIAYLQPPYHDFDKLH